MTDIMTIYNNKINTMLELTNNADKQYNRIRDKYNNLVNAIYELKYSYDPKYVVDLLDIRSDTKKKFITDIKDMSIFSRDNTTIIIYTYVSTKYKLVVKKKDKNVDIYKGNVFMLMYDFIKEFHPMNFIIIDRLNILDNYVNLFVTDTGLRFGMILVAYYMLIFHTSEVVTDNEWANMVCKDHIRRLIYMFNNLEFI